MITAYLESKQYRKAIDLFERLLEMDSKNAYVYYQLGLAFDKLGWHNEAKLHLQKALDINPNIENAEKIVELMP